ncbi:MAG TPA: hypothetical protein ENG34_00195 [Candidatus Aenigmarchaeota archaeon]|nr:hypothetical protein [Candidatus Aenigmarchaeota archaeon]
MSKMDQRIYEISGKKVVITDQKILDIIKRSEQLEMGPKEASEQLKEYLLSDTSSLSVSECFERISLWEAITREFYTPSRGRLTPINERYVEKHGLSGKLMT